MNYKCEVCGAPATCSVRDIQRRDNYIYGWVERKPIGPPHFFCEKHNRDSEEIDVTISPIAQLKDKSYQEGW